MKIIIYQAKVLGTTILHLTVRQKGGLIQQNPLNDITQRSEAEIR